MSRRRAPQLIDPGLAMIADLESRIIAANDQRIAHGQASAEQRPAVVRLAASVAERLRAAYLSRSHNQ
jgi:hypothetical protein